MNPSFGKRLCSPGRCETRQQQDHGERFATVVVSQALVLLPVLLVLFSLADPALARSLYWQQLQVRANLDSEGRLHIVENHTMVFDGDWNGGERRFNILPGQDLILHGLFRLDPRTGERVVLRPGNLAQKDHYSWYTSRVLRWRARLPHDPVFRHQVITYVLEYTLTNVPVIRKEGGYLLDHDFCFSDRQGTINHFVLDLEIDPAWNVAQGGRSRHVEKHNLRPGRSLRLAIQLSHPGSRPTSVRRPRPPSAVAAASSRSTTSAPLWLDALVGIALACFLVLQVRRLLRREEGLGRFEPLPPPDRIDTQWLQHHLFSLAPEVVGAIWDRRTGPDEVAAVLARMVVENKLASRVEEYTFSLFGYRLRIPGLANLHLSLLVPRGSLHGYERKLVDGLFMDGDETDTKRVRAYYKKTRKVFDPVETLEEPLRRRMNDLVEDRNRPLEMAWIPTLGLFFLAFFLLFGDFFFFQDEHKALAILAGFLLVGWMIGLGAATNCREAASHVRARCMLVTVLAAAILILYVWALVLLQPGYLLLAGTGVLCLAALRNIINMAKTRESREGVAMRRQLASAREHFRKELKQRNPALEDSWLPYILAFGLGSYVDHWFRRYGRSRGDSGFGPVSTGGGGSGFTGGGGMFGGAGATAGWNSAVSAMSASAGGGGAGGGGGGSGGGGGGGW